MKEKKQRKLLPFLQLIVISIILGSFISGCDMLESDSLNDPSEVQLKQNSIYVAPGKATIINLQSFIKSKDNVRLEIDAQPELGTLKSLGDDLLEYSPNTEVEEARDAITFSIFGANNMIIKEDSISIFISTTMPGPCSFRAEDDDFYTSGSVLIDVLGNDSICFDKELLQVALPTLQDGTPVYPPAYGTVTLVSGGSGGLMQYLPGPNFSGEDKFVYSISKPANVPNAGDPETVSYAFVNIKASSDNTDDPKGFEINDDFFAASLESINYGTIHQDSVFLDVTSNDIFPPATEILSFVVTQFPEGKINSEGIINYAPGNAFYYHFPEDIQVGFTDHFVYEVCTSHGCQEAEVIIEAK